MFEKITAENVNKVKNGDVLVKYPVFGEPVEEVDVNDKHNSVVVRVQKVINSTVALSLVGSTIPANLPGVSSAGPLRTEKYNLTADKTWWFYKTEISN
jgi:hypothetical protein